eukprot:Nitzschia sp. Nitz4//scaffold209_size42451//37200//39594//NITZ4_007364-RA/size42451-snap-gene-0.47-mRNA-1//1//CDS//3329541718//5562//frame0
MCHNTQDCPSTPCCCFCTRNYTNNLNVLLPKMLNKLRHRSRQVVITKPVSPPPSDSEKDDAETSTQEPKISSMVAKSFRLVLIVLHIAALLLYANGWYLRMKFHTGQECSMTYSQRVFVPMAHNFSSDSKLTQSYRWFKFTDARDPRYTSLIRQQQQQQQSETSSVPSENQLPSAHCGYVPHYRNSSLAIPPTIVLYIPGHWGSYDQARSLGAHGTTLTGRQQKNVRTMQRGVQTGQWNGQAERLENFVYEVYAVDFAEQGGALHGRFLEYQSDFVAHVMDLLLENCQVKSIILVGHSMGGYVARLVPLRHPHLRPYMPHTIVLASPLANPLYAMDRTILNIKTQLEQENSFVLSISGGLRDEMIAPMACESRAPNAVSYLATSIVDENRLGMDHRAVVWCYGLLDKVRSVIWTLMKCTRQEDLSSCRSDVSNLLGHSSYVNEMAAMKQELESQSGVLGAICIDAAMIYHLPVLYGLYTLVAALNYALEFPYPILVVLCTSFVSDLPRSTHTILTLVASSVFHMILSILPLAKTRPLPPIGWIVKLYMTMLAVFGLLGISLAFILTGVCSWDFIACSVFIGGIVSINLSCWLSMRYAIDMHRRSSRALFALMGVTAPGMFAGVVVLSLWEQHVLSSSWLFLALVWLPVAALCIFHVRGSMSRNQHSLERFWVLVIGILYYGWSLAIRGNASFVVVLPFVLCIPFLRKRAGEKYAETLA